LIQPRRFLFAGPNESRLAAQQFVRLFLGRLIDASTRVQQLGRLARDQGRSVGGYVGAYAPT
jgi:hypothetical protein